MTKIIWIYWDKGVENAPILVQQCVRSWRVANPDWSTIVLDRDNLSRFISVEKYQKMLDGLDTTKQSNLFRLALLLEHGGVWADATTYCIKPLNDWLPEYIGSGFFVFRDPGPDRLIANWFIYSERGSILLKVLLDKYVAFFSDNNFRRSGVLAACFSRLLAALLNKRVGTTRYWFSPFVMKALRIYPYFVFHYLFERVVSSNQECAKIWRATPVLSALPALISRRGGVLGDLTNDMKVEIDSRTFPMYKLTWKVDLGSRRDSALLSYLFARLDGLTSSSSR